jgi:CMP-N-acetylneuraminic acid synthetase
MKIAGIVIAKANSNRFPGKNMYKVGGRPMFWHAVESMYTLQNRGVDIDICVATDSEAIAEYCNNNSANISIIRRRANISHDDQPIFDVLKFAYQSLISEYDIVVMVLANTIGVKSSDIDKAIDVLVKNNLQEVRSYDKQGVENGIVVLKTDVMRKHEISTYVGAIFTKAKEIHYEEEVTGR